jgi:5-amino-6-(5-phosphoribosylamino)uracil reductase
MSKYPYVILKSCMSLDGYIDDLSDQRLVLSNQKDLEEQDRIRASCDAILVGAETIRKDNPKLLIRSESLQQERINQGKPAQPVKVTLTNSGKLDPQSNFFTAGNAEKFIFCPNNISPNLKAIFQSKAKIIEFEQTINPEQILLKLKDLGIERLLIEAGSILASSFLSTNLVSELHVSIAPFMLGQNGAARFVNPENLYNHQNNPMKLSKVEIMDDLVLLIYKL